MKISGLICTMLDSSDPRANASHRLIERWQAVNYPALKVIYRIFILLSIVQTRIVDNKNIGRGCVSFFCTGLSWNRRGGGRASEKGFVPGIASTKTTSWLLHEGLRR